MWKLIIYRVEKKTVEQQRPPNRLTSFKKWQKYISKDFTNLL